MLELFLWLAFFLSGPPDLAGTVLFDDSRAPVAGAEIEIVPALVGEQPPLAADEATPESLRRYVTDADGRFEVRGLREGIYRLRAGFDGYATAEIPEVAIPGQGLTEPLILRSRAVLEVYVQPPVDPFDRPWSLSLLRREGERSLVEVPLADVQISESGHWQADIPEPGTYHVQVDASDGARWHREILEIDRDIVPLVELEIPYVPVEGRVTVDRTKGVIGVLWFGGRNGFRRIPIGTDEDGRFVGVIPEEGDWRIDLEREDLGLVQHLDSHRVERAAGQRVARLDIDLPDTRLQGRTVDRANEPVAGAFVLVMDGQERRFHRIRSDSEGGFDVRGLQPGDVVVEARSDVLRSSPILIPLDEGSDSPLLELVLERLRSVSGRVVDESGQPVVGARLQIMVQERLGRHLVEGTSDAEGAFRLDVSTAARALDVLVLPPGRAATSAHVGQLDGSEAISLIAESLGGTLEIDLQGADVASAPLELSTRGVLMPLSNYLYWARRSGGGVAGDHLVVPRLAPGEYHLCRRSATDTVCASGFLAAGERLALEPPPEPGQALDTEVLRP